MAMEAAEFSFLWEPTLNSDVLRLILSPLPLSLIARTACVCRSWYSVATDPELLMGCFKVEWKLADVVGKPSGKKFFNRGLHRFAISHPLQRWDTVDSLAVKYDVEASEIRKLNRMSCDHDVHRRKRLLIPVVNPQLLAGEICYIESDEYAESELAVLYFQGERSRTEDAQRNIETNTLQGASSSAGPRMDQITAIPVVLTENMTVRGVVEGSRARFRERVVDKANNSTNIQTKGKQVDDYESRTQGNVSTLTGDLWRMILELLPVTALGQAACVCRLWHSIATEPAVLAAAFMAPWGLNNVVGTPLSRTFWRGQLGQFVISHTLQRQDTIAGLAVKYGVQVQEIRRVNNMMSDHGIHSRERLLIPVSKPEVLVGQTCFIEMDAHAKREVGILYLDGSKPNRNDAARAGARAQRRLKTEVLESLKRSMKVDDSTAHYYLALAEGDVRGALQEFSEDLQWERTAQ